MYTFVPENAKICCCRVSNGDLIFVLISHLAFTVMNVGMSFCVCNVDD
jgi:hypothetical protein